MAGNVRIGAILALSAAAVATLAAWGGVRSRPVQAKKTLPAADRLVAVADADPLELARVVRDLGDDAVLQRLAPGQPVETRLAAIRAAPWMREPELALDVLARELSGRDPDLAPAAARSAARIAGSLDAAALLRRERDAGELKGVRELLAAVGKNQRLRQDIRQYALQAAQMLAAAGVPLTGTSGNP
jgi:hypothetical protein